MVIAISFEDVIDVDASCGPTVRSVTPVFALDQPTASFWGLYKSAAVRGTAVRN